MPKYENYTKLDTANPAWKFDNKIMVEGILTEVVIHAYRQGSDVNDPEDYWGEVYLKNPQVEEKSKSINSSGRADDYAQPADSMSEAEDRARAFIKLYKDEYEIRDQLNVDTGLGNWDKVSDLKYENPAADKVLEVQKDGERTYRMFLYDMSDTTRQGDLMGSVGAGATREDAIERIRDAVVSNPDDITMEDLV